MRKFEEIISDKEAKTWDEKVCQCFERNNDRWVHNVTCNSGNSNLESERRKNNNNKEAFNINRINMT
jgi:hypothetical protein